MEGSSQRKRKPLTQLTLTDLNATSKKSKILEDDKRAGVITKMVVKNFMCHSNLEVHFKTNVSLIIGQNGSGKSAILTGLIIGLGGKASLTNRGSNMKGFVKAGQSSATIEITLNNTGPMSYRPSIYGRSIQISKHFTANGASACKIKSETGELISKSVKEIHNITTSLNIQVDNPVCILNQDTARNFLSSNDPRHKFTLFMKATKLETLAEEYANIRTNRKTAIQLYDEKKLNAKNLQEEVRKLKAKIDLQKSIVNLQERRQYLENEVAWAKVRDAEEELEDQTSSYEKINSDYEIFKSGVAKKSDIVENISKNNRELNRQIIQLKEAIEGQNRLVSDVTKTINRLQQVNDQKVGDKQKVQRLIKSKKNDLKNVQKQIADVKENMTRIEAERAKKEQDISDMEEKIQQLDDQLQTTKNDLFQIKHDLDRKEDEFTGFKRNIQHMNQTISETREKLNSLENESGNTLLLYGNDIPRVVQMIEQSQKQFQHVPRGPLGAYVKIKDKKWAVAIEGYLSGLVNTFTVDNKKDAEILKQIFRKLNAKIPNIIVSKFFSEKHDVSPKLVRAPSGCLGLCDAIDIDDSVVFNCIVDQGGIEGVLLLPDDNVAAEVMSHERNVPNNCSQGITMKGDRYYPAPSYKTYASRYHRARYLQVNTKDMLNELRESIQELIDKKRSYEREFREAEEKIKGQKQHRNELEEKVRRLITNRSKLRSAIDNLKSEATPDDINIDALKNELTEITNLIAEKTSNLELLSTEIKEIGTNIDKTADQLKQLETVTKNLESRLDGPQTEIKENARKLREVTTSEEFDNRKKRQYEARINEVKSILVIKQSNLHHQQARITNMGERPEEIRQVASIHEELGNVERAIKKIETTSEDAEQLLLLYNDYQDKYRKATFVLDKLKENVAEMKIAGEIRKKHYKFTETYFTTYIKHSFEKILEFRNFKGSIDIDVVDKKLDLNVIPNQGSQGLTITSNLSGGERSFSTVAFLYSLWQCMDLPFYFLDEFDVYMDKVNRSKVFDILLHHAKTKPKLQFVFLTPQDISFLNKNDDVTILRLQNPERIGV